MNKVKENWDAYLKVARGYEIIDKSTIAIASLFYGFIGLSILSFVLWVAIKKDFFIAMVVIFVVFVIGFAIIYAVFNKGRNQVIKDVSFMYDEFVDTLKKEYGTLICNDNVPCCYIYKKYTLEEVIDNVKNSHIL